MAFDKPLEVTDIAPDMTMPDEPVIEVVIAEGDGENIELLEAVEDEFADNLAEYIDPQALRVLAQELISDIDDDLLNRADWEETYKDGLELLGLKIEERTEPWDGASGVTHPVLAEAVVKFQSETIVETFPAQGPVKTKILGETTPETEAAAARVREDMNSLLTDKMTEYRAEHERLLWNLPIAGAAFKKVYFDPTRGRAHTQMVPAEDFIVAAGYTDLESCPRYTHRMRMSPNHVRKLQAAGFYRYVDEIDPAPETDGVVTEAKHDLAGTDELKDGRVKLYEVHVDLDLPGFEDTADDGRLTGIELPYVVTIDASTSDVLAVYRNWDEDDELRTKRMHFSDYTYIPGFGFYGYGLIHLIGGYAKGATSVLRQLIDSGTLANLPAGFKTRGMRVTGGDQPLAPGEFRDVDVAVGTIKENIMALPYKEPSVVLSQLLDKIVNEARRFAAVSDVNVADLQPNAPVGSTLAVLERTLKTMTAIQARVHASMKKEFMILKEIVADHAPESYEYDAIGNERPGARREDFNMVQIIPVSDPNASTMSQRIVQYQAVLQLSQSAPQLYDLPMLHRQMIEALGVKNAEALVPDKTDIKPMDAVAENMAILTGKPVKAFAHQDHEAHIRAHMAFGQDPKMQEMLALQGEGAQGKVAAGWAHINEHLALMYRAQIEENIGVPIPSVDYEHGEELDYANEVALSRLVAAAGERLTNNNAAEAEAKQNEEQAKDPLTIMQQRELDLKEKEIERKARKDMMDHQVDVAKTEIEAERLKSHEKMAGASVGAKMASDKLKADTELTKTGAGIGANLGGTG